MITEKSCIFCDILDSKKKSDFLYIDNDIFVLRDINPQAPVHLLIIPKKHIRSINDLLPEDFHLIGKIIMVGKEMAKKENLCKTGYKLLFNVEKGGGQIIFHLHMHLLGGWK